MSIHLGVHDLKLTIISVIWGKQEICIIIWGSNSFINTNLEESV